MSVLGKAVGNGFDGKFTVKIDLPIGYFIDDADI